MNRRASRTSRCGVGKTYATQTARYGSLRLQEKRKKEAEQQNKPYEDCPYDLYSAYIGFNASEPLKSEEREYIQRMCPAEADPLRSDETKSIEREKLAEAVAVVVLTRLLAWLAPFVASFCPEGKADRPEGENWDAVMHAVGLVDWCRVDVVPTLAARSAATLREEGRDVTEDALCAAAQDGDMRLSRLYLDAGVLKTAADGRRPVALMLLHTAVEYLDTALCTLLLDRGVDVNVRMTGGTALHDAVRQGGHELCTFLLDRGDLKLSAGKEDPVEFDSSLTLCSDMGGVVIGGRLVNNEIPLLLSSLY